MPSGMMTINAVPTNSPAPSAVIDCSLDACKVTTLLQREYRISLLTHQTETRTV